MITYLKRLFGIAETDLSNILKVFNKVRGDLAKHITWHEANTAAQAEIEAAAHEARELSLKAIAAAKKVDGNIAALLGA